MIRISCPACGKSIEALEEAESKKGRCPHCEGIFGITDIVDFREAEQDEAQEVAGFRGKYKKIERNGYLKSPAKVYTAAVKKHNAMCFLACIITVLSFGCSPPEDPVIEESENIHQAAARGNIQEVKRFLDEGVSVDDLAATGTPLHNAAAGGHVEMVEFLLERGADVSSRKAFLSDGTPLHTAANYGHPRVVEVLRRHGADVNAVKKIGTISGLTPLHDAVLSRNSSSGHLEASRILLENGADVNARAVMGDESSTALGAALQLDYTGLAELLESYGGRE